MFGLHNRISSSMGSHTARGLSVKCLTAKAPLFNVMSRYTSTQIPQSKPEPSAITDIPPHISYMFFLNEQRRSLDRFKVDVRPPQTRAEFDAAVVQKLKERASRLTEEYASKYSDSPQIGTDLRSQVAPAYVNPQLGVIGHSENGAGVSLVLNQKQIAETNEAINSPLFSSTDPRRPTKPDGTPLTDGEVRKTRKAQRTRSPFLTRMMAHYQLTKPRISLMVALTSWWGYLLVAESVNWVDFSLLTTGTLALSVTASIINQVRETDVDAKMARTMARPLVTGIITVKQAKAAAAGYFLAGCALLAPVNPAALAMGVFNVGLYGGVYTSLKRRSKLNTEAGALVGAIPPMMGYFVGLPADVAWDHDLVALLWPAAVMFTWQMQHVMLICMRRADDYNKSGLIMQCFQDIDLKSTRAKGIAWCAISTAVVAAPYFLGWATIIHWAPVYLWAVYSAAYTKYSMEKPMNQKGLLNCLYIGYLLLGVTMVISFKSQKVDEEKKYDYLILEKK